MMLLMLIKAGYLFSVLMIVLLVGFSGFSKVFAQQATGSAANNISSDLTLDLNLAEQSADPNQKLIVSSQTTQAVASTKNGDSIYIQPRDIVDDSVKTQPVSSVVNPDQTTSEQVISTPVVVEDNSASNSTQSDNGNTNTSDNSTDNSVAPTDSTPTSEKSSNNLVPGTTVIMPDDNAAPKDPSVPTTPSVDTQPPVSDTPPSPDNGSSNPPGDNGSSVQGISTKASPLQIIISRITSFIAGKGNL